MFRLWLRSLKIFNIFCKKEIKNWKFPLRVNKIFFLLTMLLPRRKVTTIKKSIRFGSSSWLNHDYPNLTWKEMFRCKLGINLDLKGVWYYISSLFTAVSVSSYLSISPLTSWLPLYKETSTSSLWCCQWIFISCL